MKKRKLILISLYCFLISLTCFSNIPQYFCVASNSKYFPLLLNLIGSIHQHSLDHLEEIAVFNLGLTQKEKQLIKKMKKVSLHEVERTHPDLLTPFATRPGNTKPVPGWYAWKPVIIKQALDMFPYVVVLDAGSLVLKPIDIFFEYLQQKNYFFKNGPKPLGERTTNYVKEKFKLNSKNRQWILTSYALEPGFMGLTRNMYHNYVLPMYELSKDLRYFADDGSAPKGFGAARHDQIVFSVLARILNLKISTSPFYLEFNNKKIPFEIVMIPATSKTYVQLCRNWNKKDYSKFIQYKP